MRNLLLLILAVAAGCDGSDEVWDASATQLVLRDEGGLYPRGEPTAACPTAGSEYTFVVADSSLHARSCAPATRDPYPLELTTAQRTLSAAERDELIGELEALHVVKLNSCGADKPMMTVRVTSPRGTLEYGDSFYSCLDTEIPKLESTGLDAVAHRLGLLAFPSK